MTFKMDWSKVPITNTWEAIQNYNHPENSVRERAWDYLFDCFYWNLVEDYNKDKPEDEQFDGLNPNDRFLQFAVDELNYLFLKD